MPSLLRGAALAGAFALVLAACGGDDDASQSPSTVAGAEVTSTTEAAETTTSAAGLTNSEGQPQDGDLVAVHYTGTLDSGEQFDSSEGREPLEFVVGADQVISGFDDAVRELTVGESLTVRIPPEEAYGVTNPELVIDFPIEEVPEEFRVVGIEVLLGGTQPATVIAVTEDTVTVDANHRLANEALTFEIELVSVTAN